MMEEIIADWERDICLARHVQTNHNIDTKAARKYTEKKGYCILIFMSLLKGLERWR